MAILRLFHPEYLLQSVLEVARRFPLVLLALLIQAGVVVWDISHRLDFSQIRIYESTLMVTSLAILFSLVITLRQESLDENPHYGNIMVLICVLVYGLLLPEGEGSLPLKLWISHAGLCLGLLAAIIAAPILVHWHEESDARLYGFLIDLGAILAQAITIALGVMVMGIFILFSLEYLFQLSVVEAGFQYHAVACFMVIAPIFVLMRFPRGTPDIAGFDDVRFLRILVCWMILPFIGICFIILYAYSIKVLANFSTWPRGEVSWLVIIFASVAYAGYIASQPFHLERWVMWGRRIFPLLLLPQIAMLFYAISLRIDQYGWTINRYLVVVFGVWLLLLSLYDLWARQRGRLLFIPASLFVVIMVSTIEPWSMRAVSERSQLQRLETILLEEARLLTGNHSENIESAVHVLSEEQFQSVQSIIRYLCTYHECEVLYQIPALAAHLGEVKALQYWEVYDILEERVVLLEDERVKRYYGKRSGIYHVTGMDVLLPLDLMPAKATPEAFAYYDGYRGRLVVNDVEIDITEHLNRVLKTADAESMLGDSIIDFQHQGQNFRLYIDAIQTQGREVVHIDGRIAYSRLH